MNAAHNLSAIGLKRAIEIMDRQAGGCRDHKIKYSGWKSLLNGPCGGNAKGKCEVGGWKKDCAWILIYEKLKERGRLDRYKTFREPKDYRVIQNPREIAPNAE